MRSESIRRILETRKRRANMQKSLERAATTLADAVREGGRIVFASDNDGTMSPFAENPRSSRVERHVRESYEAIAKLPGVEMAVITGGDAERTAHVLSASGVYVNAFAAYGAQRVTWNGTQPTLAFHPQTERIRPVLNEVRAEIERALQERMHLPPGEQAVVDDGDLADSLGRALCEDKGTLFAFHPKGADKAPQLMAWLDDIVPAAVATVKSRSSVDLAALEIHPNNGNNEVVWNLGLSKFTVLDELINRQPTAAVFSNCDDKGDISGLDRIDVAREAGLPTFVAAVYNPPEPDKNRVGTPAEVLERADVVLPSSAALGAFYADALRLAAKQNPDLTSLVAAAATLPAADLAFPYAEVAGPELR